MVCCVNMIGDYYDTVKVDEDVFEYLREALQYVISFCKDLVG